MLCRGMSGFGGLGLGLHRVTWACVVRVRVILGNQGLGSRVGIKRKYMGFGFGVMITGQYVVIRRQLFGVWT